MCFYDGVRKVRRRRPYHSDYFKMMSGGIPGVLQEAEKRRGKPWTCAETGMRLKKLFFFFWTP